MVTNPKLVQDIIDEINDPDMSIELKDRVAK